MSFACPKCGGTTVVRDTREGKSPDGTVYLRRRRYCTKSHCRTRLTTAEIQVEGIRDGQSSGILAQNSVYTEAVKNLKIKILALLEEL